MSSQIKLSIPAISKYVSIVRLTASGLAAKLGFSSDDIEDIKVAVSEACNNSVQYAYPNKTKEELVDICFTPNNNELMIEITDHGIGFDISNPPKRDITDDDIHMGLGLEFIKKLMTTAKVDSSPGKGTKITMTKRMF